MNNNDQSTDFSFTYSAAEQVELRRIREKYTHKSNNSEDKMQTVRRLDSSATRKALIIALAIGIIGSLILGFGMSMCMTALGAILGVPANMAMPIGIAVGMIGGVLAAIAYPVYNAVLKSQRKKIAPEIIRLTDELMK